MTYPTLQSLLFVGLLSASVAYADDKPSLPTACLVGDRIALFTPPDFQEKLAPSLALAAPVKQTGSLPGDWSLKPSFGGDSTHASASVATPAGADLYGTGEVTGPLRRNGRTITLWNTDNFAYGRHNGLQLYQSHPWVLGVRPDGSAFGILFDTTWRAELRTGDDQITLASEGASFKVYVIDRESPTAVMKGLAELIGTMPLPPRWALGFHQCRYSYFPDARVREIADEFRARRLPCDVIWMDIDYMDGFRIFTFDKDRFPDPTAINEYLHGKGFHSVWMIDPGVKADPEYAVFQSGSAQHLWVQTSDGQDYHGKVWPGVCVFPDFTMPATQLWWGDLYHDFIAKGIDGVWNDMNEPAVFNGPDSSMPPDNIQQGGGPLPAGPQLMYHNVFGMLMARSTREGILKARPDKRPFVLTRANFLGGQRYAATWTGDNKAEDSYMRQSIPMSINLGLSGQPFNGPDIGGYDGQGSPELYAKWISLGAFYPFSRAHAAKTAPNREPWVFGPEIEKVAQTALERRYRLLPYLYSLAQKASVSGEPIMRPVFFADPKDADLRAEQGAFLVGADLLVAPPWIDSPKLPKGIWRDISLLDGDREKDGRQPALKLRGGSILPLDAVAQSSSESTIAPDTLLVALDASSHAEGTQYEDAGDGFEYRSGGYAIIDYTAALEGDDVVVRGKQVEGEMHPPKNDLEVRLISERGVKTAHGDITAGIRIPAK